MWTSATLRAIRMCLRPTVINRDNTPRLLVSLGCASGTNFTLGIIPQLIDFALMQKRIMKKQIQLVHLLYFNTTKMCPYF